ncbi:MAG: MATE family efflux transporter [Lachnospiraceae bacterium]|nr:MATE family efflux transporter [Lachnospiraceae bacterium]
MSFRQKFIGDKAFYKMILAIVLPIIIQNTITSVVNMLDNIMVGRVGTEQMSGVSIANQIFFIYMLAIFGGLGGIGIFSAQFFGKGDFEGLRISVRAKLWLGVLLSVIAAAAVFLFGERLLSLYLNDDSAEAVALTLKSGLSYLHIMMLGLPGIVLVNVYGTTLRECGETVVPMKAGITAVFVNLVFNYLLIYGKFGFPEMGVSGAAAATVLSRYVEAAIIVVWAHQHKKENPWISGLYRSLRVPAANLKAFFLKGTPLLLNEVLFSTAMAMLTQSYSLRGLSVIAAFNIANTINNVGRVFFMSMGNAVSIVVGQKLGAGELETAKDYDNKIIAFSIMLSFISMIFMLAFSGLFPKIYNTSDEVRHLATKLIVINALFAPMMSFVNTAYFTIRSGGKTVITFLFDSAFLVAVTYPICFLLIHFTGLDVIPIFTIVTATEIIKCIIGYAMIKKNVWIQNIVG